MVAAHARFLAFSLREARYDFADIQICCKDGFLHLNRLLVGLIIPCLSSIDDFDCCSVEVAIILPHSSVEQVVAEVDQLLCQVRENEGAAKVKEEPEVEIIVEEEVREIVEVKDESEFGAGGTSFDASIIDPTHSASVSPSERRANCKLDQEQAEKQGPHDRIYRRNDSLMVGEGKKDTVCTDQSSLPHNAQNQPKTAAAHIINSSIHTQQAGQKPHRCEKCGKGFVSKSNMKAHMRLHEGTALRYPCLHCDKKFSHPSEVKQHQVVHTGVRAYCCSRCGNRYSRYPSLWKHQKKCKLLGKADLLLVSPADRTLLVKRNEAALVGGPVEGSLVVDEVVITEEMKTSNTKLQLHPISVQTSV